MLAPMVKMRRSAVVGSAALSAILLLSGCGLLAPSPPLPSGAQDPDVVAARERSDEEQVAVLERIAGREPLSARRVDSCGRGQDNWWVRDGYDWRCVRSVSWVLADSTADPAALITEWRSRLVEVGCEPDEAEFDMVESYWQMFGVPGENSNGDPYTIDDLPSASAWCGTARVGIGFSTPRTVNVDSAGAYVDEVITDEPHDVTSIRGSFEPHVVILGTNENYHSVPGYEAPKPEVDDGYCACYSGGTCDCPGG